MKRRESGQGLVEFALLLPAFILAVMMIVDIGRAVYYYSVVYNAAREGARAGVIDQSPSNIEAAAEHLASGILAGDNPNNCGSTKKKITSQVVTVTGTYLESYDAIEVTVCYEFTAATPFLGRLTGSPGNNIALRSKATMQLEQ